MLAEILEWFLTPCPLTARRLGYLNETIAIRARHRRHRSRWQPHLEATRAFVERAASATVSKRCATVLGSGPLYDVPLDLLSETFDRVELVDFIHPQEARRAATQLPNVALRTEDISGAAAALAKLPRTAVSPPNLGPPLSFSPETDLVISVNLLSQLPEIPYNRLTALTSIPEAVCRNFAATIVRRHLDMLSGVKCHVALITDVERCYVETNGIAWPAWGSLYGVELSSGGDTWLWEVAPAGEAHPDLGVRMTVRAFDDFSRTYGTRAAK